MAWPMDSSVRNSLSRVIYMVLLLTTYSTSSRSGRWRCRMASPFFPNQENCDAIKCSTVKSTNSCICTCFTKRIPGLGVQWKCSITIKSTCNTEVKSPSQTSQFEHRTTHYKYKFFPGAMKNGHLNRNADGYTNFNILKRHNRGVPSNGHHTKYLDHVFLEASLVHDRPRTFIKNGHHPLTHNIVKRADDRIYTNKSETVESSDKTNSYKNNEEINETAHLEMLTNRPKPMSISGKTVPRDHKNNKTIKDTSPVPAWAIAIIVLFIVIILVLAVLIIY